MGVMLGVVYGKAKKLGFAIVYRIALPVKIWLAKNLFFCGSFCKIGIFLMLDFSIYMLKHNNENLYQVL